MRNRILRVFQSGFVLSSKANTTIYRFNFVCFADRIETSTGRLVVQACVLTRRVHSGCACPGGEPIWRKGRLTQKRVWENRTHPTVTRGVWPRGRTRLSGAGTLTSSPTGCAAATALGRLLLLLPPPPLLLGNIIHTRICVQLLR